MIDAKRWVLAETWLSLGLRVEWAPSYGPEPKWQSDDETRQRFTYAGRGLWLVQKPDGYRGSFSFQTVPVTPSLGTETLRHELAHYLAATRDERDQPNFGFDATPERDEEQALLVEQVIDAMLNGANRIATLSVMRKP